jgi:hypothetical protein
MFMVLSVLPNSLPKYEVTTNRKSERNFCSSDLWFLEKEVCAFVGARCSVLGARCSVLGARCSVLGARCGGLFVWLAKLACVSILVVSNDQGLLGLVMTRNLLY